MKTPKELISAPLKTLRNTCPLLSQQTKNQVRSLALCLTLKANFAL